MEKSLRSSLKTSAEKFLSTAFKLTLKSSKPSLQTISTNHHLHHQTYLRPLIVSPTRSTQLHPPSHTLSQPSFSPNPLSYTSSLHFKPQKLLLHFRFTPICLILT
ncbi:hypothetical protein AALP_AA2G065600 [Arabis alpina]|uniref:Uncharacterized protein n=1 Tax=Arabis alpina TaxID=50452 RepID=A0A087HFP7_ARAAL|nr:hypothetical protein AALP_AA2G065600 [Arabis alpina]